MSNQQTKSELKIDLTKWTTQKKKADSTPKKNGGGCITLQYLSKLIRQGKLASLYIPELDITLVER